MKVTSLALLALLVCLFVNTSYGGGWSKSSKTSKWNADSKDSKWSKSSKWSKVTPSPTKWTKSKWDSKDTSSKDSSKDTSSWSKSKWGSKDSSDSKTWSKATPSPTPPSPQPSRQPTEEPVALECPEPLVSYQFSNLEADTTYGDGTTDVFDLELFDGSTKCDSSYASGGPYLSNGNLVCVSGFNDVALSNSALPFDANAPRTYVVLGYVSSEWTSKAVGLFGVTSGFSDDSSSSTGFTFDNDERVFDSLTYYGGYIYSTSDDLQRTEYPSGGEKETTFDENVLYTTVYEEDGTINIYRNCELYTSYNKNNAAEYVADDESTRFILCSRSYNYYAGPAVIDYAAYYDYALSSNEVSQLCQCNYDED